MPNSSKAHSLWQITSQGDRCLSLAFGGDQIDVNTGQRCAAAAHALRAAQLRGITDIVPAFNSVAVHYEPRLFGVSTSFQRLSAEIDRILTEATEHPPSSTSARQIVVPVCYGGVHGPDLEEVATHCNLTPSEVIAIHSGQPAYVFMLGFAPGAPYIGVLDPRLAIGRRATPRTALPAGSVGIANLQTFIYPNVLPGGWRIIGATPLVLFDFVRDPPALFAPGDTVQFVPVSESDFIELQQGAS